MRIYGTEKGSGYFLKENGDDNLLLAVVRAVDSHEKDARAPFFLLCAAMVLWCDNGRGILCIVGIKGSGVFSDEKATQGQKMTPDPFNIPVTFFLAVDYFLRVALIG